MKILHTADLHIASIEDVKRLELLVQTAIIENCGAIFICGDLFDKNGSYLQTEGAISSVLERFDGLVFILSGNHDFEFLKKREKLSRNSFVIAQKPTLFVLPDKTRCFALPYFDDRQFRDDFALLPEDIDILLIHGSFYTNEFFYGSSERKSYYPIFSEDLDNRFRYVALGHFHSYFQHQVGKTIVVNPGSPMAAKKSDLGKRAAAVLDAEDFSVKKLVLDVPYNEELHFELSFFETSEILKERILHLLLSEKKAMLYFKFSGTLPMAFDSPFDLKTFATDLVHSKGLDLKGIDTENLSQLNEQLLSNPVTQDLFSKLDTLCEKEGLDPEKARQIALSRLNTIL